MSELKPCPFCGGEAASYEFANGWSAECLSDKCPAQPVLDQMHHTEEQAIAAWNTRATDAEVERLEEAFRLLNIAWIDEGERAEAAEAALERVKRLPKYDIAEVRRYGGYHDTKWMKAADVLEALEKDDE